MYLEHFELTDFPFIQSARNALYYAAPDSVSHCATIHHWLDAGHGMLVISGEEGVGRASLAHHALDTTTLPILERFVIGSLPLTPLELMQGLAIDMGLKLAQMAETASVMHLRHAVRAHLLAQASLSRRVCLIVHNADQLDQSTLAFLQDLGKDHTLYLPLCHVILLVGKNHAKELGKLRRDMTARHIHKSIAVKALNLGETTRYIEHRLRQVAYPGECLFDAAMLRYIQKQTAGKPQLINALCDSLLLACCQAGGAKTSPAHLQSAIAELGWDARFKFNKATGAKPGARKAHSARSVDSARSASSSRKQLGALEQSVHELISGVTTIGRAPDCSIRIEGADVSPYQALIVKTDEGMFIRNEGSRVPLFLNGGKVDSANLAAGDSVTLGDYQFAVDIDSTGALTLVSSFSTIGS